MNTHKMFHVPSSLGPCDKREAPATENNPFQTKHEGRSLSRDSGLSSTEVESRSQMSDSADGELLLCFLLCKDDLGSGSAL